MTARQFLNLLWKDKPQELEILIWTLQGATKLSHWRKHPDDASEVVAAFPAADVYFGVGLSPKNYGPHARCPATEVAAISAIWMDIDLASEAHPNQNLPKTIEEALGIVPLETPPSLVIATGNGVHCHWLLKEIEVFASTNERERAAHTVRRWQSMLVNTAKGRGWKIERLADLARVLRVPGTRNLKDPQTPKPVVVYRENERRYNLSELDWFLDNAGVPDEIIRPVVDLNVGAPPPATEADTSFRVNLQAAIPAEMLASWLETDLQFYRTWMRQRNKDFSDNTQHPYDLALANFAITANLTPQQTVDLIIHHRRLHHQGKRKTADYFIRTMRRARASGLRSPPPPDAAATATGTHNEDSQVPNEATAQPPPPPVTHGEDYRPQANASKNELLKWITRELRLPVPITEILKITGNDPTYLIKFPNNEPVEHSVGTLVDQRSFRHKIVGRLNHSIPTFKAAGWDVIVNCILKALTEVEGGAENELAGAIREHLHQYLYTTRFANPAEDPPTHNNQLPRIIDGRVAISTMHFQHHLDYDHHIRLSIREITGALVALGAEQRRIQKKKSSDISRWILPASNFPSSEYTYRPTEEKPDQPPERKPN